MANILLELAKRRAFAIGGGAGVTTVPVPPSSGNSFLLEDGSFFLLEDGSKLLLEAVVHSASVLLEDGSSHILLEDGTSLLSLEA